MSDESSTRWVRIFADRDDLSRDIESSLAHRVLRALTKKGAFSRALKEARASAGMGEEKEVSDEAIDKLVGRRTVRLSQAQAQVMGLAVTRVVAIHAEGADLGLTPESLASLLKEVSAAHPPRKRSAPAIQPAPAPPAAPPPPAFAGPFVGLLSPPFLSERFEGERREKKQKKLEGHYLLLRRNLDTKKLLVASMTVTRGEASNAPLNFTTEGASANDRNPYAKKVDGNMFVATADRIFTVGRMFCSFREDYLDEIRSSILILTEKPGVKSDSASRLHDLKGIRLGLGRESSAPRGYRVWCSRLAEPLTEEQLARYRKDFSLKKAAEIEDIRAFVTGFDEIMKWLGAPNKAADIRDDEG